MIAALNDSTAIALLALVILSGIVSALAFLRLGAQNTLQNKDILASDFEITEHHESR